MASSILNRARLLLLVLPALGVVASLALACTAPADDVASDQSAFTSVPGDDDGYRYGYGYGYGSSYGYAYRPGYGHR